MKCNILCLIITAVMLTIATGYNQPAREDVFRKPNIVLILADDLGYGDPGCYGQKVLFTEEKESDTPF